MELLRRRITGRRDAGQGALEYIGMLAVAATLSAALMQAVQTVDLEEFFTAMVQRVTQAAAGGEPGGG